MQDTAESNDSGQFKSTPMWGFNQTRLTQYGRLLKENEEIVAIA